MYPALAAVGHFLPDYQNSLIDVFGSLPQRVNTPVPVERLCLTWIEIRRIIFVKALHIVVCLMRNL